MLVGLASSVTLAMLLLSLGISTCRITRTVYFLSVEVGNWYIDTRQPILLLLLLNCFNCKIL